MKRAIFLHTDRLDEYRYPEGCPFKAERAGATLRHCRSMGFFNRTAAEYHDIPALTDEQLCSFHSPAYLKILRDAEQGNMSAEGLAYGLGTEETPVFRGMTDYAALACGATVAGARLLLEGDVSLAFNPSGGYHHAFAEKAEGFCYLNDVVLACDFLTKSGKKVLFLDVDAHHCDGVQSAFYTRRDVMTVSLHESGKTLFPGTGFEQETGAEGAEGYTVNIPLPAGCYDAAWLHAFNTLVPPLIDSFAPDIIVCEAGMDILNGDPLTHFRLTNNAVTDAIASVARTGIPLLVTGGGGYHVDNTVRGWTLLWSVLTGQDHHDDLNLGLGGVMMESTDWQGGLRDREVPPDEGGRSAIDAEVDRVTETVRKTVFPLLGL